MPSASGSTRHRGGRSLDGVGEHVRRHLVQTVGVTGQLRRVQPVPHGDPAAVRVRAEQVKRLRGDGGQVDGAAVEPQPGCLGRGEVLEILQHPPQAQHLLV